MTPNHMKPCGIHKFSFTRAREDLRILVYARAKSSGYDIAYDLTDEPWGVRRFYVRDPVGKLLNILSHPE